jgi:phosphatidylserine/phosphatidylglycerophosphate/cardiolipin synthase-like enzyme
LLEQLKAGGVDVAFALPVSSISVFKVQPDLRLHHKIVVIDDAAAYTGSFNLVDPRFFKIFGFKGGLLHTKSVVVERHVALFGSVNLDVRSFWLDFEVTLGVYDPDFAERLLALQDKYIEDSIPVDIQTW